jgi:hypothetical protein
VRTVAGSAACSGMARRLACFPADAWRILSPVAEPPDARATAGFADAPLAALLAAAEAAWNAGLHGPDAAHSGVLMHHLLHAGSTLRNPASWLAEAQPARGTSQANEAGICRSLWTMAPEADWWRAAGRYTDITGISMTGTVAVAAPTAWRTVCRHRWRKKLSRMGAVTSPGALGGNLLALKGER